MNKFLSNKALWALFVLLLVSLACNLPTAASPTAGEPTSPSVSPLPPTVTHLPTQVLPRSTHQQDEQNLPKPTLPAPPSQITREPPAQVIMQPTTAQSGQTGGSGDFYVTNQSSSVICYYYMALHTDTEWGSDLLGEDGMIHPGETFTITGVPYGNYDAQALDCDGNVLGEAYGFDFPPNDMFTLSD